MNTRMVVDKSSAAYRQNLVKAARTNLLVAVAFTVLNLVMLLIGSNRYFLFSMTLPYYLTFFGYTFDFFRVDTYTYTGLILALVPLAAAGVCWFMSKKDNRWLWGGTVVFGLDTVAMLAMIIWSNDTSGMIIDIVFHGWVLYTLIRGLIAAISLRKPAPLEPWEAPVEAVEEFAEVETEAEAVVAEEECSESPVE